MNAVQCPTMAAESGLSETMTLDDDSGAHEGNDEDNGDDGYGIESHDEQDAIARQVQLLARFATPPTCGPVSGVNTDNERSLWTNSDCMYLLQ